MAITTRTLQLVIDTDKAKQGAEEAKRITQGVVTEANKAVSAYEKLRTSIGTVSSAFDQMSKSLNTGTFDKLTSTLDSMFKSMDQVEKNTRDMVEAIKNIGTVSATSAKQVDTNTTSLTRQEQKIQTVTKRVNELIRGETTVLERWKAQESYLTKKLRTEDEVIKKLKQKENALKVQETIENSLQAVKNKTLITEAKINAELDEFNSKQAKNNRALQAELSNLKALEKAKEQHAFMTSKQGREMLELQAATAKVRKEILDEINASDEATKALKQQADATDRLAKSSTNASRATRSLNTELFALSTIVAGFSFGMFIMELGKLTDGYKNLQNRIAVVTGSTDGLQQTTRELLDVAQRSRTSLEAVADVYAKITRVNEQYGLSQKELLDITTAVSQAVSMSGATAQGAQGAMIQFAQALQNNFAAAAQEMNSLIEQTPALAELVADAMNAAENTTVYTMGNIKKAATDGLLEVEAVLKGILLVTDDYAKRFELSQVLLSQGWQQLVNSFQVYLGELDAATGITKDLADGMMYVAKNFDDFEGVIVGVTAALGTLLALTTGAGFAAVGTLLGVGGIVVGGLTVVVGLLAYATTELANHIGTWEEFGRIVDETLISVVEFFSETDLTSTLEDSLLTFSDWHVDYWLGILDFAGNIFNKIGEFFRDTFAGQLITKTFELASVKISQGILEMIQSWIDEVIGGLNFLGQGITNWVNKIAETLDIDVKFEWSDVSASTELMNDALANQSARVSELETEIDNLITTRKDQIRAERELQAAIDKELAEQRESNRQRSAAAEVTRKSQEALEKLRKSLDPVYAATVEYEAGMTILNKALKESDPLYKKLSKALADNLQKVKDSNDPLKAQRDLFEDITKELKDEERQIGKTEREMFAYNYTQRLINQAVDAGVDVNEDYVRQLEAQALAVYDLKIAEEERLQSLEDTKQAQLELRDAIADTFMEGFEAAMESGEDFKDWFDDLLKTMALNALKNQIVIPIVSSIMGIDAQGNPVAGGGVGEAFTQGGIGQGMSALWNSFTGGFNKAGANLAGGFTDFATSNFGASLGLSAATVDTAMATRLMKQGVDPAMANLAATSNVMGSTSSFISQGLQYSPWGAVGSLGANLLGFEGSGNMLIDTGLSLGGSVVGGSLGASYLTSLGAGVGGPVGAVVGAFLGTALSGLFKKEPSNKEGVATMNLQTGAIDISGQEGDKFSQENRDAAQAITEVISGNIIGAISQLSGQEIQGSVRAGAGNRDPLTFLYTTLSGESYGFGRDVGLGSGVRPDIELGISTRDPNEYMDAVTEFFADLVDLDLTVYKEAAKEGELLIDAIYRLESSYAAVSLLFKQTADDAESLTKTGAAEFIERMALQGEAMGDTVARLAATFDLAKAAMTALDMSVEQLTVEDAVNWVDEFIADFGRFGESTYQTAQRVVGGFTLVKEASEKLGFVLSNDLTTAIDETVMLIDEAGGLDVFAQNLASFYSNFMSEFEIFQLASEGLSDVFSELGLTLPTSNEGFRQLITGLNMTNQADRELLNTLMALNPQIRSYIDGLEQFGSAGFDITGLQNAVSSALGALRSSINAQKASLTDRLESRKEVIELNIKAKETEIELINEQLEALTDLRRSVDTLKRTSASLRIDSFESTGYRREDAQSYLSGVLTNVRSGGTLPLSEDLEPYLKAIQEPSEDIFSSFEEYAKDFYTTKALVDTIVKETENGLLVQENELSVAKEALENDIYNYGLQIEALEKQYNASIDALNAQLESATMLYEGLTGVEQSVDEANDAFTTAIDRLTAAVEQMNTTPTVTINVGNDSTSLINGAVTPDISTSVVQSVADEYKNIPAYANGGTHSGGWRLVGEEGPELEYTPPSRIYSNPDTSKIFDMSEVVDEVRRLREDMRNVNYVIARNTQKTAKVLENWDYDGQPEVRV